MIKAIFFDFYNTLVGFNPPREELHAAACLEMGIKAEPRAIRTTLAAADEFYHRESLRQPLSQRPPQEQQAFYADYEQKVLLGAGIEVAPEVAFQIFSRVRQRGWKITLYEDSLPVVEELRWRGLVVGVVSNVDRDIRPYCQQLGIEDRFHFLVTSWEVGVGKPDVKIFRRALEYAQAEPSQVIHVGDQYDLDVVGARNAGIKALLIDRDGLFTEVKDCPRLTSLWQVRDYL